MEPFGVTSLFNPFNCFGIFNPFEVDVPLAEKPGG